MDKMQEIKGTRETMQMTALEEKLSTRLESMAQTMKNVEVSILIIVHILTKLKSVLLIQICMKCNKK